MLLVKAPDPITLFAAKLLNRQVGAQRLGKAYGIELSYGLKPQGRIANHPRLPEKPRRGMGAAGPKRIHANAFFSGPRDKAIIPAKNVHSAVAELRAGSKHEEGDIANWNLGDRQIFPILRVEGNRVRLPLDRCVLNVKVAQPIPKFGKEG